MKTAILKPALFIALVMLFSACQFSGVKGSGNVVTENRMVPGTFKSIEVANGLDVELEQANQTAISVIADDNLQGHISISVENGVLKISSDVNNYINIESKKIVVKAPEIESIEVREGSSFKSKNTIKGSSIALKSDAGATLKIAIECEKATAEATNAGAMTIDGKAINLEIAAAGAGRIEAERLLSNDIIASASTAGVVDVHPLVSLSANASTGASINYHNVPKNLTKKSATGGSITKQ